MWPYYVLVFLPMIPLVFKVRRKNRIDINILSIILFFSLLLLMLVFRADSVGRDLENYEFMFNSFRHMSWNSFFSVNTEKGFVLLNKIIGTFTSDFRWVLVVCAILTLVPFAWTYVKMVEDPMLTIALFINTSVFLLLFSGLRQSLSIAIGLIAFEFVRRKKFWLYALFVVLAFFFHRSSFMLIFMYPVFHLPFKRKWLLWMLPATALVIIFNKQLFALLLMITSNFWNGGMNPTGAYMMLVLVLVFAAFSVLIPDEELMDKDATGLRNFLLLSVIIQVFASLNPLAMRMNYYYLVFLPLLIPLIISRTRIRYRQVAILSRYVMVVFFLLMFFLNAPMTNSLDTFPYHFFWEEIMI